MGNSSIASQMASIRPKKVFEAKLPRLCGDKRKICITLARILASVRTHGIRDLSPPHAGAPQKGPKQYSPTAASELNPTGSTVRLPIAWGARLPASTRLASSTISAPYGWRLRARMLPSPYCEGVRGAGVEKGEMRGGAEGRGGREGLNVRERRWLCWPRARRRGYRPWVGVGSAGVGRGGAMGLRTVGMSVRCDAMVTEDYQREGTRRCGERSGTQGRALRFCRIDGLSTTGHQPDYILVGAQSTRDEPEITAPPP